MQYIFYDDYDKLMAPVNYYRVEKEDGSLDHKRTKFCNDNIQQFHDCGVQRLPECIELYYAIQHGEAQSDKVVYHCENN